MPNRHQPMDWNLSVSSLFLLIGLVQSAYALLGLVLMLFAGVFEVALNLIPAMFAVIPEEPMRIGFPHAFVTKIVSCGALLGTLSIVAACRGFYRRQLPKWTALGCMLLAALLAVAHLSNQLQSVGGVYLAGSGFYLVVTIRSFSRVAEEPASVNET